MQPRRGRPVCGPGASWIHRSGVPQTGLPLRWSEIGNRIMQYISVEHQQAIGERFKVASIIVFAFCVSVGVFALMGRLIEPPESLLYSERLNSIIPPVVIVLAMGVIVLRRVWMSAVVMRVATRNGAPATLNRLLQMTIVCAALSEIVA